MVVGKLTMQLRQWQSQLGSEYGIIHADISCFSRITLLKLPWQVKGNIVRNLVMVTEGVEDLLGHGQVKLVHCLYLG